jgi:hypothetical protein
VQLFTSNSESHAAPPVRAGARGFVALALIVATAFGITLASDVSDAATSGSVVGANVLGATSVSNGCTGAPATQLGTLTVGSSRLTDTGAGACSFSFQSSNSTATAHISQRDRTGTAMGSVEAGQWTDISDSFVGNTALAVADASVSYRGMSDGTIRRSDDGGDTWIPEASTSSMSTMDTPWAATIPGRSSRHVRRPAARPGP